jgi:indolepyruvate ferredoxin oxidoreductase, alpha subunit
MREVYSGSQALALGAVAAGIRMATSYPGSPSSGTMNSVIEMAREFEIYVEWSANERVATEMAIGASMAGVRSLVCTKSVGMNVMLDPLMCLNLTGVRGGLVILLGDDPGAYGSQNDQDTRQLAHMLELPMLEPATPSQGFEMMKQAFDLSEEYNFPVIIRITRSFEQSLEDFSASLEDIPQVSHGYQRETYRFVPYPANAVEMHTHLHERLITFGVWTNQTEHNQIHGDGPLGIVAAGFAHTKLQDVIGETSLEGIKILQLSTLYPLPQIPLCQFLKSCKKVLVLEEIDPFVEDQLKGLAFEANAQVPILGKRSGHVQWEGELYRWQIVEALKRFWPDFSPPHEFLPENEAAERPNKINHCRHYAYEDILAIFQTASREVGQDPIIIADPGCMVKVADQLDAKFAIGSSVAVASGISKAGSTRKVAAFFGDSAFFHSTIPAICNATINQSELLMILLDNSGAASTGLQPSMGTGRDAFGESASKLSIPEIARACGVEFVRNLEAKVSEVDIQAAFREGLNSPGVGLVIVPVSRKP